MSTPSEDQVKHALSAINAPGNSADIVAAGMVSGLLVSGDKVIFSLNVPADQAKAFEPVRLAAEQAVQALPGVSKVTAVMTAERKGGPSPTSQSASVQQPSAPGPAAAPAGGGSSRKIGVPGVSQIIAVASGKGGVGKSTTSINLALALSRLGKKVGILDADIYGPSLPRLVGVSQKPKSNGRVISPIEAYGLKIMSMGFLVEEETPMIWRGPMVMSALTQMLREVAWGDLDVMVVDMPPGTGDAQLTMAQQVPLAGAVIVSTPQDIALIDARKGLNMFKKVEVPLLGIIENMSTFICPNCGTRSDIFGHGGARDEALRLGVPFLGEVPLHMDIRKTSDGGTPVVASMPDGPHAEAYVAIAQGVLTGLDASQERSAPAIVFE